MRWYNNNNIVSRIILILLTVIITFALAAPVLQAQEKRQTCLDSDAVHKVTVDSDPDVTTVLGKRALGDDVSLLWDGWWHFLNVLGKPASSPPIGPLPSLAADAAAAGAEHHASVPVPPPNLNLAEAQHVPEVHDVPLAPPQGGPGPAQDVNTLWDGRWHFLNVLGKPEPSPPPAHTTVTPPPSIGSGSDSDSYKRSTMISNARRAESPVTVRESLLKEKKAADSELNGTQRRSRVVISFPVPLVI